MEQAKIDIKKAVIKKDRLTVVYNERFTEANYINQVTKNCDQIVHSDLKETFSRLKMHLVVLCEQKEAIRIAEQSFRSPGFADTLPNYIITGYQNDSTLGIQGLTILGCKLLESGKTVDLKIFVPFDDETYPFSEELKIDAMACDEEVDQYLFSEKWGIKQESLDFEAEEPEEAVIEEKPKKSRRKKTTIPVSPVAFDATA